MTPRTRFIALLALTLLVLAVVLATSARASGGAMIDAHNQARAAASVAPVSNDGALAQGAASYARQLADSGKLAHSSTSSRPGGWKQVTENVAKTHNGNDLRYVHDLFMGSPTHRPNVVSPAVTHVGVGSYDDGTRLWVVVWYGIPNASPAPAPEPKPEPEPEPVATPTPSDHVSEPAPTTTSERAPDVVPDTQKSTQDDQEVREPKPVRVATPGGGPWLTWEREVASFDR